jgi:hypothetical protein
MQKLDHWGRRSIDFLLPYFRNSSKIVKIASGFFTVQGFTLIGDALDGKTTYILVGYDETQGKNLVGKLLADVQEDLKRWDYPNRREAIRALLEKLIKKELVIRENDDEPYADTRIRKNDHGKVYIIDNKVVLVGSINLTMTGLLYNDESDGAITEPDRVRNWVIWFQEKWDAPDTTDVTRMLMELLGRCLKFVDPFDIYLKSIKALVREDDPKAPRSKYKFPASYQQVIIKRLVRQLKTYRGAMLVASTGMGKTIMATDVCYRLKRADLIDNVIVFAPKATHGNWEDDLDSAGIHPITFSREVLGQSTKGEEGLRLKKYLSKLDDRYMVIIDESQYFRNEKISGGQQKLSFKRLIERVNDSGCFVLLLTATPYAKSFEDMNNQLKLLPHTAPRTSSTATGQQVFENMIDDVINHPNAWRIPAEDYFEIFRRLEVVSLISTSWVAKNFGTPTENGDYVVRPDGTFWIPQIHLSKVNVPVPFEVKIKNALSQNYFKHYPISVPTREGGFISTTKSIEEQVNLSWASSPLALEECLHKTINDSYKVAFVTSQEDRFNYLSPLLAVAELKNLNYRDDPKLLALAQLIERHEGEKVILFTERHATAVYLEQAIKKLFPYRNTATTIQQKAEYEYDSIDDIAFQNMIEAFAPISNRVSQPIEKEYDVLILTDAHSTGINLQDANVLINYDLAWTADVIIQRAGRILRFWNEPRQVYLYTFVGVYEYDVEQAYNASRISQRFQNLSLRTKSAEKISEIPVFPEQERQKITNLGDFNKVTIEEIGNIDVRDVEEYSGGSPFLRHITAHMQNEARTDSLGDDISSAKLYNGSAHLVYLLLRYNNEFVWLVYNITKNKIDDVSNDSLLEMLECTSDTPIANVDPDVLEEYAQSLRHDWCEINNIPPEDVERICALYLKPQSEEDSLETLIQTSLDAASN